MRLIVHLDNQARDHRLRLRLPTGLRGVESVAGTQFGSIRRLPGSVRSARIEALRERGGLREKPGATDPAQRYVAVARGPRGLALLAPGFFEFELTADGDLVLTLLRSVGELSRSDLDCRPGHAAWPMPTPSRNASAARGSSWHWPRSRNRTPRLLHGWSDCGRMPSSDCPPAGSGTIAGPRVRGRRGSTPLNCRATVSCFRRSSPPKAATASSSAASMRWSRRSKARSSWGVRHGRLREFGPTNPIRFHFRWRGVAAAFRSERSLGPPCRSTCNPPDLAYPQRSPIWRAECAS